MQTRASVLLVGHEIDLAKLVRWLLEADGHVVEHALNGDAALALLRTCPQALVVVLLTTRPHAKTANILETTLEDPALQRHAFVLLTALAEFLPDQWQELVGAFAIPVLAKPLGITEVSRTVADVATRLRARRSSGASLK